MSNFLTKAQFSKLIEQTVVEFSLSYMDSILYLCDKHRLDVQDVRKYLSPVIKNKLEVEAMHLNMLPKQFTNQLDC